MRGKWVPRPCVLILIVAAVTGVPSFVGPMASAEYAYLAPGYTQWDWVERGPIEEPAVRDDGWLIVEVLESQEWILVAVPPWGSSLDDGHQLGDEVFRSGNRLAASGDSLWVIEKPPRDASSEEGGERRLVELDAVSGERLRVVDGWWWFPALEVDPVTDELWVFEYQCERDCRGEDEGRIRQPLVRLDPETGQKTEVLPDPRDGRRSPYQPCQPEESEDDGLSVPGRSSDCGEEPMWVAVSPDGARFAVASALTRVLEIFDRDGNFLHAVPHDAEAMHDLVWGLPGGCFEDLLVYADNKGLTAVPDGSGSAAPHQRLAVGSARTWRLAVVSSDALVGIQQAATGYDDFRATVVACEGTAQPAAPSSSPREPAGEDEPEDEEERPARAAAGDGGGMGVGTPAGPPSGGAQQTAPAQQPQTAPGPQPGVQAGFQPGGQAAPAPGGQPVGAVGDAPAERPELGFSASGREAPIPGWAQLAAGILALVGGACGAVGLRRPEARARWSGVWGR